MAVINRAKLVKELVPGLNALFGLEYKQYEQEHLEIFTVENSDSAFEEEVMNSGFGPAQTKAEGQSVAYDEAKEEWTARYDHETIALGFMITEEAIDDNKYESLSRRYTKALARSMAYTKQVKAAAKLNNAFNSAYTGGDGKELCATDHPLAGGGSWRNEPTVAADLNETSLEQVVIDMSEWKDERGLLIAAKPKKLIIPPALTFVAERLLKSPLRVETANNDINALKSTGAIPGGAHVNHFLTDPDAWFVLTDVPNGLKMFVRKPLTTKHEPAFDNGVLKYKAQERYSFGWSDPRGVYGSPGA
jgi:hypothetical protein